MSHRDGVVDLVGCAGAAGLAAVRTVQARLTRGMRTRTLTLVVAAWAVLAAWGSPVAGAHSITSFTSNKVSAVPGEPFTIHADADANLQGTGQEIRLYDGDNYLTNCPAATCEWETQTGVGLEWHPPKRYFRAEIFDVTTQSVVDSQRLVVPIKQRSFHVGIKWVYSGGWQIEGHILDGQTLPGGNYLNLILRDSYGGYLNSEGSTGADSVSSSSAGPSAHYRATVEDSHGHVYGASCWTDGYGVDADGCEGDPTLTASDLYGCDCHSSSPQLQTPMKADPVIVATGDFAEAATDASVGGLGVGLNFRRTYNSLDADDDPQGGLLGAGWSATWLDHVSVRDIGCYTPSSGPYQCYQEAAVTGADGATTRFMSEGYTHVWNAAPWGQASLTEDSSTGAYTYTLPNGVKERFSSQGALTSVTDRNGNETTVEYSFGDPVTVTDPSGRQLSFDYNHDGTLHSLTDPAGESVTYGYTNKDLTSVTDMDGKTVHYGYDSAHHLTTVTDARSHTLTNTYDSKGRVTAQEDRAGKTSSISYASGHTDVTDRDGDVTRYVFDHLQPTSVTTGDGTSDASTQTITYDDGLPASVTDGNGNEWTYEHNSSGDVTSITDPLDRTTTATFSHHRPTSITLPSGHETTFTYDSDDNLVTTEKSDAETSSTLSWTNDYDTHGQLTSSTDPLDHTWDYDYNTRGDVIAATSPLGHETTYAYDDDSRLVSSVSPRGNATGATATDFETLLDRDPLGLVTTVTDPHGHETHYAYNDNHRLVTVTDADGDETHSVYDNEDRPTSVTRGYGTSSATTESSAYTDDGKLSGQTDGLGQPTTYAYDHRGELTTVTDPLNRETSYGYDDAGNLTTIADAAERTETLAYDDANQLIGHTYSDDPDAAYTYTTDGLLHTATIGSRSSTLTYDSLDRLSSSTNAAGQTTGYHWDDASRLSALDYPDVLLPRDVSGSDPQDTAEAGTVEYGYDADDQMTSVTDWLDTTTSFDYSRDGDLTSTSRAGVDATTYAYSRSRALTAMSQPGIDASDPTLTTSYGRTDSDRLASTGGASSSYDAAGRLTGHGSADYGYDDGDNLTATITPGGSTSVAQTFDDAHQLLSATPSGGSATSFGYDDLGNRLTATRSGASAPAITYGYDQANRLTGYQGIDHGNPTGPGVDAAYSYDPLGQRATRQGGDILSHETYDLASGLPLMIEDGGTAFIYGPGGTAVEHITASGDQSFYTHDQLGSTTRLTDLAGHTQATYSYDAYGNTTASIGGHSYTDGTGSHTIPGADTPFRYAGEYSDPHTGLQYLRARNYDPQTGQFLTRDPIESLTGQPYSYANDDPLNETDPSGLLALHIHIGLPSLEDVSDFAAGFGDTASFGLTEVARKALGVDNVDYCSSAYAAGGTTGMAFGVVDGEGEAQLAAMEAPRLYRFGTEAESASDLAAQAARAEATGKFPHGVSTFSKSTRPDAVSAPRSEVEKYFDVQKTGKNPYHHTVVLPKPVTEDIAKQFNDLFGRGG